MLFPPLCFFCRKEGRWLCEGCASTAPLHGNRTCPSCTLPSLNGFFCVHCGRDSSLTQVVSVFIYDERAKRLVHSIKYGRVTAGLDVFTPFIVNAWKVHGLMLDMPVIIPIPLHPVRLRERGFNQAEIIARVLADFLQSTVCCDGLSRKRNTVPQSSLSKEERASNVKDVFECQRGEMISGADILLIDDVTTTGSTLQDAARALKGGGARSVSALTLAHGA